MNGGGVVIPWQHSSISTFDFEQCKVNFISPNTTFVNQPLNQGTIYSLKSHFRVLVLRHLIVKINPTISGNEMT